MKQINMKSKTESIISALRVLARDIQTDDGVVNACLEEAAGRLEGLHRELIEAIKERNKTVADLIKQRDEAIASARPEPSRLEIAAMAMQGMLAASSFDTLRLSKSAFEYADALIAAAKEVK